MVPSSPRELSRRRLSYGDGPCTRGYTISFIELEIKRLQGGTVVSGYTLPPFTSVRPQCSKTHDEFFANSDGVTCPAAKLAGIAPN